jgi:16S rRNA (cytidine1402-2'-O)-methyltransferase
MLYLVPTPVGNLEDMTLRALRVLREVDYVLAEDTRVTRKLLRHFLIEVPVKAYHAHNEHAVTPKIIRDLSAGKNISLVCDAGTPGISDPGYLLVNACIEARIPYTCLPGATAIIPALVMSGMPLHAFQFTGFLPQKKGRKTAWEEIAGSRSTTAFYESPHRLIKSLQEAIVYCGTERRICVVREISKIHEEAYRDTISGALTYYRDHPEKCVGEIVIILEGAK